MGVQKFRTIEEMNAAPTRRIEHDAFDRFIEHCETFRRLGRVEYRPGVWRFRTLEEAQDARLERLRKPRGGSDSSGP